MIEEVSEPPNGTHMSESWLSCLKVSLETGRYPDTTISNTSPRDYRIIDVAFDVLRGNHHKLALKLKYRFISYEFSGLNLSNVRLLIYFC